MPTDHPEVSAQVFPSSSKSISSAHVMAELQPLQLATAVGFDTFSVPFFTTLSGIWRCFPLLWMCAFLNDNSTQTEGQFHSTAVVCSCCFQSEIFKVSFSQSTPCAWHYTTLSVIWSFISLAVPGTLHRCHCLPVSNIPVFSRWHLMLHEWCFTKLQSGQKLIL